VTFDPRRDPLPTARDAIDREGAVLRDDVVFLARALVAAHEKVDQLYDALEKRSDSTRAMIDRVLRDTAHLAPSTEACRGLRAELRAALDRGPVFEESLDQERLDWLGADPARVLALHQRMLDVDGVPDRGVSLREVLDQMKGGQSSCS
jgi:hypothetical protein